MNVATFNNKPLGFVKFEKIEGKEPQFVAQTTMLDGGRNITIWYVETEDKYYACIS